MGASWIVPQENYGAGDGWGFADANAINNNLDYIRNQDATFFNVKTIESTGVSPQFIINRSEQTNQGFSIQAGGGLTAFESREGTGSVYGEYSFKSSKGASVITIATMYETGMSLNNTFSVVRTADSNALTTLDHEAGASRFIAKNLGGASYSSYLFQTENNSTVKTLATLKEDGLFLNKLSVVRTVDSNALTTVDHEAGASRFTAKNLGSASFSSYIFDTQNNATTKALATLDEDNLSLNVGINPTTTPTSGTWTTNTTIPRGQYNYTVTTNPSSGIINILHGADRITSMSSSAGGGSVYSDGTNVVINFDSATGGTVTYWKY
jgi:hypothetical protein